jgi:hypothetical protein
MKGNERILNVLNDLMNQATEFDRPNYVQRIAQGAR